MPGTTVYLEASKRTQDLLNIKWMLRSAGYAIGSTWHEEQPGSLAPREHWNRDVEQLQFCDGLVVICPAEDASAAELALMAGFALARGLQVTWIGAPLRSLAGFKAVEQFNTVEDYRKQAPQQKMYSRPVFEVERFAA
jgi:hypothetical protein